MSEEKKTQECNNAIAQKFYEIIDGLTDEEIVKKLEKMSDTSPDKQPFLKIAINVFLDTRTLGYLQYNFDSILLRNDIDLIERLWKQIDENDVLAYILEAFLALVNHEKEKCVKLLKKTLCFIAKDKKDELLDEKEFSSYVIELFKNGVPGLYKEIRQVLETIPTEESAKAICEIMDDYYQTENPYDRIEILYPIVSKFPNSILANTLMAYTYYEAKFWGNAVAYFEKLEKFEDTVLMYPSDNFFSKGWAYSRMNEHSNAAESYQYTLELEPEYENALNNLGWEYYKIKKYPKALKVFEQCLKEDRDIQFAANNYVRTLLAMKRYQDAKKFVQNKKYKISKDLIRRIENVSSQDNNPFEEIEDINEKIEMPEVISKKLGVRKNADEQFSSEKILEDELVSRIESGMPVFGKMLKIYRRHGEYGRQYIIDIGRLDLLAEDKQGNLYIIELKKDSGYDDPYAQITAYLDWFEANFNIPQKLYGIICLNNPTEKLKDNVRKDSRIKLFHYSIVYEEVK